MAGESRVVSSESSHNATEAFINKILERMEALESYWTTKMDLVMKELEDHVQMREEFDELRTWHEYTDLKCTQLEIEVKEIGEAGDKCLAEIVNLRKSLDGANDEITVLKKVVRHNSSGGVSHVKVKEPESYDGTRSGRLLVTFSEIWSNTWNSWVYPMMRQR